MIISIITHKGNIQVQESKIDMPREKYDDIKLGQLMYQVMVNDEACFTTTPRIDIDSLKYAVKKKYPTGIILEFLDVELSK